MGTYGYTRFFTTSDIEKGEEDFIQELEEGGGRERFEVGGEPGCKDVNKQETSDGDSVGVPPDHIRSLCAIGGML